MLVETGVWVLGRVLAGVYTQPTGTKPQAVQAVHDLPTGTKPQAVKALHDLLTGTNSMRYRQYMTFLQDNTSSSKGLTRPSYRNEFHAVQAVHDLLTGQHLKQ
jgi:hypothetical protein